MPPPPVEEKVGLGPFIEQTIRSLDNLVNNETNVNFLIDYSLEIMTKVLRILTKLKGDWGGLLNIVVLGIDSLTNDRKIANKDKKLEQVLSHINSFKAKLELLIEEEYFNPNQNTKK